MSKIESDTNTLSKILDNILLTYQINNRHSNPLKYPKLTPPTHKYYWAWSTNARTQICYPIISNLAKIFPLHALVLTIKILSMGLSTAIGETLEYEEMVINKIWTSC